MLAKNHIAALTAVMRHSQGSAVISHVHVLVTASCVVDPLHAGALSVEYDSSVTVSGSVSFISNVAADGGESDSMQHDQCMTCC